MKVIITGETSPLSIARMWYADHIGEVFEVDIDKNFPATYYKTTEPIFKGHQGHIKFEDCQVITDESQAYGNDCVNGACE